MVTQTDSVLCFCAHDRSGVVCRVKYCNSLPDIPFDPKFIHTKIAQNHCM